MARPKPTKKDLKARAERAKEWREFMVDNLFTEIRLAEVLGLSRRTVQMIRAGNVTPHPDTLRKFKTLKSKYESEKVA